MVEDAVPVVLGHLGPVTVRTGDVSLLGGRQQYIPRIVEHIRYWITYFEGHIRGECTSTRDVVD